jgi:hypothetical protein
MLLVSTKLDMVQKNTMTADFEKLTYDSEMLKEVWSQNLITANKLVEAKWTSPYLLPFIEWINGTIYSGIFFSGFSLGNLLISKPIFGKLNYQQTLSIKYDNQTDLFTMEYSDWDLINSTEEYNEAIIWTLKCPGNELGRHFIDFLKWNKNWC